MSWWRWYHSLTTTLNTPMFPTPWCPPPSYSSWQRRSSDSFPLDTLEFGKECHYGYYCIWSTFRRISWGNNQIQSRDYTKLFVTLIIHAVPAFGVLIQNTYPDEAICEWNITKIVPVFQRPVVKLLICKWFFCVYIIVNAHNMPN